MLLEYFDFADRQSHRCVVKKTIIRASSPLFTGVRGIGILRSSPFGDSRKFATRKQRPSNTKDSPFE
jgi:hypothetical protein